MTTVVLIHGAGGGAWEYDAWKPVLTAAGFRVVARDLMPASGGLARTTFEDYLTQVRDACRGAGHVVLIGASMGGTLAMKAAEEVHPSALVLVNSVPPAGVSPGRNPRERYPQVVRWANGPISETRTAMLDSDEATIQKAWRNWRDESGAVMNALTDRIPVRKPVCPTLVVIGERDTDVQPATGMAIAAWAGADIHRYQGMSHVGPLLSRRAPEVATGVATWLRAR